MYCYPKVLICNYNFRCLWDDRNILGCTKMTPIRNSGTHYKAPVNKKHHAIVKGDIFFLQEQISVRRTSYSFAWFRFFFCLLCSVTLSANRHPSGSRPKRGNLKPLVRNRTPEKDRYLVKANWVVTSFRALFGPSIACYFRVRSIAYDSIKFSLAIRNQG